MPTPELNLKNLDFQVMRRNATPVAERVLMTKKQLDDLLNPVRHHVSGNGDRRARQMVDAYNHFREMTIDQVIASAGVPEAHLERFEADLVERAERVNESFKLLACHALAELTDPSPPEAPKLFMSGAHRGGGHNLHFGSETDVGLASFTVDEMNRKANHFWNSVRNRIKAEERPVTMPWDEWEPLTEDEDDDYPDLY